MNNFANKVRREQLTVSDHSSSTNLKNPAIACHNLETAYVTALKRPILRDLSFEIANGEFVALLGLNGAGKSTLLRALLGLVSLQSGSVDIQGIPLSTQTLTQARQHLGFLPQGGGLVPQLSAFDNVLCGNLGELTTWQTLWGFSARDRRTAFDLLDQFGLSEHAYQAVSKLSGGQQQRVAIARTLIQSAQILLVDEPTAGLDVFGIKQVMETLATLNRDRGMTIVVILHDLAIAEAYASRAMILDAGQMVYDGECQNITSKFDLRMKI